jgi:hypothetical protein
MIYPECIPSAQPQSERTCHKVPRTITEPTHSLAASLGFPIYRIIVLYPKTTRPRQRIQVRLATSYVIHETRTWGPLDSHAWRRL